MNCSRADETAARFERRRSGSSPRKHYGYRRIHQEGSHIILETDTPSHHRISIPNHNPLRVGTLNAILRAVARVQAVEKEAILQRL